MTAEPVDGEAVSADPAGSDTAGLDTSASAVRDVRRTSRRASRPSAAGVDPKPSEHVLNTQAAEDRPEGWGDASARKRLSAHDEQLRRDRPPHWG